MRHGFFIFLSTLLFFGIGLLFGTNDRAVSDHHVAFVAPEGKLSLEGIVATVPEIKTVGKKETVSFVLSAQNFFRDGRRQNTEGKIQVFLHNPARAVHYGDRLRLRGTLESPKENRNPYAFDYAAYLSRSGIFKIFRGIGRFSVSRQIENRGNQFLLAANRLRIYFNNRIELLFPSPCRELASALTLGFRKNIPRDIQDAFIKTGTAHLIAISGLNISLVAGLFYFLMSILRIGRTFNLALTVVFIGFYTLLAGANMPVLRAGIMGTIMFLGFLLGQERNLKSAFFFSFLALLVWNPGALFQASFQLSFIAMASLIFILPKFEEFIWSGISGEDHFFLLGQTKWSCVLKALLRLRRSAFQTLLASFAVTIGMFPILIWYFNLFSVVGFLANVIAIPICTLAIASTLTLLLIDLIFPPLAQWLAVLPLAFYRLEIWLIDWFSKFPAGYFYVPKPHWLFFVFYYGCLAAWLLLANTAALLWVKRAFLIGVGLVTCIFLAWAFPARPVFTFFDLGKTTAFSVSFSNGANFLVDAGRSFPSDQAYWILRPFFMASGIQKLDGILLTRMDGWHAGGLRTLVHHVRIQRILIPPAGKSTAAWNKYISGEEFRRKKIETLSAGDQIRFGAGSEHYVEVLVASSKKIGALRIVDRESRMLYLTSNDRETFRTLSRVPNLDCEFVFLPHHEFDVSEDEKKFLKSVSPRFIIVNQQDRIDELRTQFPFVPNSKIIALGQSGAVKFTRLGNRWRSETFRRPFSSVQNRFALAA